MGVLLYSGAVVEFDDRTLTHLQVVITRKLQQGEAFLLSWLNDVAIGDGRAAMWLTPTVPVFFKFDGSRVPAIDQGWIDALARSADSARGLVVLAADGSLVRATGSGARADGPHAAP